MDKLLHMTDDELVNLYTDGCNEAFDVLLCRHKDRLFDYITYHLHQFQDKADDVFQETFVKAIVTIREGRYAATGHFYAWLTRIAYNVVMDIFRDAAQLPVVETEFCEQFVAGQRDLTTVCHETQLVNEETCADLQALMDELPNEQREVVTLRFFSGLSFKEIATKTGVSINTSLGRMRYALLNMRRMAQDRGISLEMIE